MSNSGPIFTLRAALVSAYGDADRADLALKKAGFARIMRRKWLEEDDGRAVSMHTLHRLLGIVPDRVAFLINLGLGDGQDWQRFMWVGQAMERAAGAQRTLSGTGPERSGGLVERMAALKAGRHAEYWITQNGRELAEEGLNLAAFTLMGDAQFFDTADYILYGHKTEGWVSVILPAAGPAVVSWDSTAVLPEALACLLESMAGWERGQGWQFRNRISDTTLTYPTLAMAQQEVQRALRLARVKRGSVRGLSIRSSEVTPDRASAVVAKILGIWRDHHLDAEAFAARLPRDVQGMCCLYRFDARGLRTDYIGSELPPISGVPWRELEGMSCQEEPGNPEYRSFWITQLVEGLGRGKPAGHDIHVEHSGSTGSYRRWSFPFNHPEGGAGLLTFTTDVRGAECLFRLNS
jgi:hypothetical protein